MGFMTLERKITVGVSMALLVCSLVAFGQETTAGIQGTVKDPSGAVIPGVNVEVTSPALIGKKSAVTDAGGYYRIEQLPPGVYNIIVNASGFGPQTQSGLQLSTGALPTINFSMAVGGLTQEVSVSAEAAVIDVTESKVSTTVTDEILTALPKTRSFQSLIPFAPGARQEPLQGGRDGNRTNGFQIDGAADSENVYLIDGINTTDIVNGGVGKNFQSDFIQEVQIKSSSFEAEFGGALGGVINAVPKRGSNTWHGEVKTYYESSAPDAIDACNSGFTASGGAATFTNGTTFSAYNTTGRVCG